MMRILVIFFLGGVLGFIHPVTVLAQEVSGDTPRAPLFGDATAGGELISGGANCFDYYRFGSVVPNISAEVLPVTSEYPQMNVQFTGQVENNNAYPLVGVDLYVKVLRPQKNDAQNSDNGGVLVAQFRAVEGLTIPGNGKKPVRFTWSVPTGTLPGDYVLATFAIVDKKYNLAGLSFTDDITGGRTSFVLPGEPAGSVEWDKNGVTVNDQQHRFTSFIPQFPADVPVKILAPLVNSSTLEQRSTVTWKQYSWDGQRESELLTTQVDEVTLAPGEKRDLSYSATTYTGPVTYLIADVDTGGAHSIINVRFARNGVPQARINFPSLDLFPLRSGEEATVFSCLHGVGPETLEGGKLTLSLVDGDGKTITEKVYEGKIGSAMMGVAGAFTPDRNYNTATLITTLSLGGKVVEESKTEYDCESIDPATCIAPSVAPSVVTPDRTGKVVGIGIAIVLLIVFFWYIWRRRSGSGGTGSPSGIVAMGSIGFLVFFGGMLAIPVTVEANTTSWTSDPYTVYYDDVVGNCTQNPACGMEPHDGNMEDLYITAFAVSSLITTVTYEANVYNNVTNALISDGAVVPIGTALRFQARAPVGDDLCWFGTGGFGDSPCGKWGVDGTADVFITQVDRGLPIGKVDLYGTLQAPVPALSYSHSGTAGLSCNANGSICTVTASGSIASSVNFGAVNGVMYGKFRKYSGGSITQNIWYGAGLSSTLQMRDRNKVIARGCDGSGITSPWSQWGADARTGPAWNCYNDIAAQQFILPIPAKSIGFNLTAAAIAVSF